MKAGHFITLQYRCAKSRAAALRRQAETHECEAAYLRGQARAMDDEAARWAKDTDLEDEKAERAKA